MGKEISIFDDKGRTHGYQQCNYAGIHAGKYDRLKFRVMYKHGLEIGYEEWHRYHSPSTTSFYIR